jgi:hypothetical protein
MRHKEPEVVTLYKEWVEAGPPRCCHTCEHYLETGVCAKFFMTPPEEFAATVGACEQWDMEVPF